MTDQALGRERRSTVVEPTGHRRGRTGPRPMRADARRNYERLVAAARRSSPEQGGGASMEAIAKEAGVGVGTLYRHFPKRIDIVEAVYRDDVDGLVASAEELVAELEPWAAARGWLEAFVRYASTKRTFLSELHEAFEKNPQLKSASRERIEGAIDLVLAPGPGGRRRAHRSRRVRPDAAPRLDVHERDPHARAEPAAARHDRGRAAATAGKPWSERAAPAVPCQSRRWAVSL